MGQPDETDEVAVQAPQRRKVKKELRHQRKSEVVVDGVVIDRWAEPRLSFDGEDGREQPFADTVGERKTLRDRLADEGRHRVTGALLAHTGDTCGGCAYFKLKPRLPDYVRDPEVSALLEPGTIGRTGQNVMGMLVCSWAATITTSLGYPRTSAGEPACVHHEPRAGGVIKPEFRPVPCRSCQAPAVWVETGKARMMIDPDPVDNGNIEVVRWKGSTPVIAVHGKDYEWPEGVDRYVSHFVTCPDANQHRKRTGGNA